MQTNGCFHATYLAGSVSESDSVVDEGLRLMIKDYFHTTYSAGSHSESDPLVDESLRLMQRTTSMPLDTIESLRLLSMRCAFREISGHVQVICLRH